MLTVTPPADTTKTMLTPVEFVNLYPNPAKQIVNLAFYAQTEGQVIFEILDQLGEPVMSANLGQGQTSAQYSVTNLSNAIYYWRLKDAQRTIKVGKIAIMK
jgi:K+-transporting ATPase c subunit